MNDNIIDETTKKMVLNMNANLNDIKTLFSINFNILDNEYIAANQTSIQTQLDTFLDSVRTKMTELGYKITI
jgi:hypothetical protein